MSHIPTPTSIEDSPVESQGLLTSIKQTLGSVPNLFRIIGNSPATLEGFMGLNSALASGLLDPPTRERIALAVAEVNGCNYCLAAHSYLGSNVAKLTETEILANRHGTSGNQKAAIAVEFAVALCRQRGTMNKEDIDKVLAAGFSAAEIVEIVGHVALNTLTNYMNEALGTEIDFPAVNELGA